MTENITTIQIKKTTHERLNAVGRKGQSYDDIISRLIDIAPLENH